MLDVYQTRYPTWAPDIAAAIAGILPLLAEGSLPGPALHFSAGGPFTKRDMGEIMAAVAGADPSRAAADDRPPSGALRPKNAKLACPDMEALGLLKITPFREAIAQTLDSIRRAGGFV
jgi:dTDP-4-dehydrorhamnose reductase